MRSATSTLSVSALVRVQAGSNAVSNRHDQGFRSTRPSAKWLPTSSTRLASGSRRHHSVHSGWAAEPPFGPARRRAGLLRVVVGVIGEDLLPFVPVAEPQGSGDVLVDGNVGGPGGVVPVDVGGTAAASRPGRRRVEPMPRPQQGWPSTFHQPVNNSTQRVVRSTSVPTADLLPLPKMRSPPGRPVRPLAV